MSQLHSCRYNRREPQPEKAAAAKKEKKSPNSRTLR
jgi:hypothetical protein